MESQCRRSHDRLEPVQCQGCLSTLLAGSISNFLTVIDLGGENGEKIVKKILSDTLTTLHCSLALSSLRERNIILVAAKKMKNIIPASSLTSRSSHPILDFPSRLAQFGKMSPLIQPGRLLDLSFDKIRDLLVVVISDNIYYHHDEDTQDLLETLEDSVREEVQEYLGRMLPSNLQTRLMTLLVEELELKSPHLVIKLLFTERLKQFSLHLTKPCRQSRPRRDRQSGDLSLDEPYYTGLTGAKVYAITTHLNALCVFRCVVMAWLPCTGRIYYRRPYAINTQ